MAKDNKADLTWDAAILHVLKEAKGSVHYVDIANKIVERGLKRKVGATPAASVAATLSWSIRNGNSPYQKVAQGEYALTSALAQAAKEASVTPVEEFVETEAGALRAFGMFWIRENVIWSGKSRLLGRQANSSSPVDFAEQVGVYLLHDRDRVVYVGRAGDTLFGRLKAHTTDRLGGRWDRFSWFGLREVTEEGLLSDPALPWTHAVVIETLEALLIECLEPPQNRKRGDFSAVEFLQLRDPEIEKAHKKQVLEELARSAGMND